MSPYCRNTQCLTACAANDPIRAACLSAATPGSSSSGPSPALIGGVIGGVAVVAIGAGFAVKAHRSQKQAALRKHDKKASGKDSSRHSSSKVSGGRHVYDGLCGVWERGCVVRVNCVGVSVSRLSGFQGDDHR